MGSRSWTWGPRLKEGGYLEEQGTLEVFLFLLLSLPFLFFLKPIFFLLCPSRADIARGTHIYEKSNTKAEQLIASFFLIPLCIILSPHHYPFIFFPQRITNSLSYKLSSFFFSKDDSGFCFLEGNKGSLRVL